MVDFVIVGDKAKKAKGRFGGESGGRNYDRSYELRHLKLTSKQLVAAALEDLHTYEPVSKHETEFSQKRDRSTAAHDRAPARPNTPRALLKHPRPVYHNSRKVVAYPDGMRIYSANY